MSDRLFIGFSKSIINAEISSSEKSAQIFSLLLKYSKYIFLVCSAGFAKQGFSKEFLSEPFTEMF